MPMLVEEDKSVGAETFKKRYLRTMKSSGFSLPANSGILDSNNFTQAAQL